ncbi:uncharacterized protein LOC126754644 [Bactrocera neohumeralis]|uniref:uncharacterized protein LOC120770231 n=1 Tax=Bactrocera tryoni TaxID=59916 RepID=UPI001A95F6DF|nr:uncharacterized protein LOC120770231 [Bactrocera tryoni]XP_050322723.1 uncharacterized protein LOC126754644 [Bactrocera neohumeralis]
MSENKDLVEINLNTTNSKLLEKGSSYNNNMSLFHFKDRSTVTSSTIPNKQGLSLTDSQGGAHKGATNVLHSIFGGSIEFVPNAYRSPTDLSCLRQMYCPDCEQRLHMDTISYDRLLYCCLPIFPFKCLYKRAIDRRQSGNKVICKRCGGNLGYWKQK